MAAQNDDPIGTVTITFEDGRRQVIHNIHYTIYEAKRTSISPYGSVPNTLNFIGADGVHTTVANKGIRAMTWRPKRQR